MTAPDVAPGRCGHTVFAALLLLVVAAPARALDVEVEVGFDGLVVEGGWTPVVVRCSLGPDEPALDGRVVLARPREVVASVEAPLRLQPGESATARLAVPSAPGLTYEVEVQDARGRALARARPAGATALLLPEERLVVFVGTVGLPGLADGGADRPRVARLAPDRLPRDAHALDAAAAIVLKPSPSADAAHVELARDPAVAAALERYVRAGGTLLLVPGDVAFWRDGPLDALAPARVDGRAEEPASAFEPLLGAVEASRGVPVFVCEPRPGARVTRAGRRHPLVIERALGRGRVVLVTFDPDREHVRGAPRTGAFLADLVGRGPSAAPALTGADVAALLQELLAATPPLSSAWFYVLALVAVAQLLAMSLLTAALVRRRGPWAGLVVPPLASAVLAGLLIAAGALARGDPRVTTLLLELPDPGGGAATVHAAVGLEAGRAGRYSVELPPALRPDAQQVTAFDLLRPRAARAALTLRPGRAALVGPIETRAHGRHALLLTGRALDDDEALRAGPDFSARAVPVLSPPPDGATSGPDAGRPGGPPDIQRAAAGVRVEVTSREARPLDGLRVLVFGAVGGRLGPLGPLPPGETVTFAPALHGLVSPGPRSIETLDGGSDVAASVLEGAARRLELAWMRAAAAAPSGAPTGLPLAWVLHAQVEPGPTLTLLDAAGTPVEARGRTIRVICAAAEGGW